MFTSWCTYTVPLTFCRTLPSRDRYTRCPPESPDNRRYSFDFREINCGFIDDYPWNRITNVYLYTFENQKESNWRFRSALYSASPNQIVAYFVSRRVDCARDGVTHLFIIKYNYKMNSISPRPHHEWLIKHSRFAREIKLLEDPSVNENKLFRVGEDSREKL